jgi:hypothetical protein
MKQPDYRKKSILDKIKELSVKKKRINLEIQGKIIRLKRELLNYESFKKNKRKYKK